MTVQALPLASDLAEYLVVHHPELGDDIERDQVAGQLIGAFPELRRKLGR